MADPITNYIHIVESKSGLTMTPLPSGMNSFAPIFSSALMQLHYGKLYRGYVNRYNANQGDRTFSEAGAYLHEVYFSQFKPRTASNRPTGRILDLFNREFDSFDKFKEKITEEAMAFKGSGWIYVNRQGKLKTIQNHRKPSDGIVILIDLWEHAFQMDYSSDKKKYIDNIWKIMDWSVINQRL